ncbi:MAG: hypothetical protein ACRYFS_18060 [Janthinobacterium lividum]
MKSSQEIERLLSCSVQQGMLEPEWIASLADAVEEHETTRAIPLQQLRGIYRVRAKINKNNGSPITGFDELLRQMDAMDDEPICISSFLTSAGRFIAFTDATASKLVGILFTPTDKIAPIRTFHNAQSA